MKIVIDEIPEEGLSVELLEQADDIVALSGGLDFAMLAPVSARMEFMRTGTDVRVSGDLNSRLGLVCSRCLKEFEQGLETVFSIYLVRECIDEREKELTRGEMDVNHIDTPELDTAEILLAQLSLESPTKPLCASDCKGLCPRCGADSNSGPCGCSFEKKEVKEDIDPRLAGLKDFKVR